MTDKLTEPTTSNEDSKRERGYSQYQHQTLTLHNTVGMVLMSILAFALLAALLRQQARYHELAVHLGQKQ
ncbi:MAG: hypothetical protein ABSG01_10980 [Anaerolineales bacterium]|jgi:hypothetical protein